MSLPIDRNQDGKYGSYAAALTNTTNTRNATLRREWSVSKILEALDLKRQNNSAAQVGQQGY